MSFASVISSSVTCTTLQYPSTSSHSQHNFLKYSYWTQNVSFDFLYNLCLTLPHSKKNSTRYDHQCACVFTCLSDFNGSWILLDKFPKNTQIPNFQCWPPDSQTDTTKLAVLRNPHSSMCHLTWQWRVPSCTPACRPPGSVRRSQLLRNCPECSSATDNTLAWLAQRDSCRNTTWTHFRIVWPCIAKIGMNETKRCTVNFQFLLMAQ